MGNIQVFKDIFNYSVLRSLSPEKVGVKYLIRVYYQGLYLPLDP